MAAFAANSVLCRLALSTTAMDAATFTAVRVVAGALALWAVVRPRRPGASGGSWASAGALFLYAAAFSVAYLALTTGTGALLLFGAVQFTMISWGLRRGERLTGWQTVGMAAALGGLVYLVLPGLEAPPLPAALAMVASGAG
jgi:drug/metabolite transporter (DMT)-like permease